MKIVTSVLVALTVVACSSKAGPPASPIETAPEELSQTTEDVPETTRLQANCEALEPHWRLEYGEPGEELDPDHQASLDQQIERFECKLELDIDGDGVIDTAFPVSDANGKIGVGIRLGNGGLLQLGGGQKTVVSPANANEEDPRSDDSYDWIVAWKTLPMADGKFVLMVLGNRNEFAAPGALGDGLQLSGTDAAAVFYLSTDGWRWLHLGF